MNKKKLQQMLVLGAVLVVIIGIWFGKNRNNTSSSGTAQVSGGWPPLIVTELNLEEIFSRGLPVIITFGSDFCPPCRQMMPALEEIHTEMQGKAVIHYVDIWKTPDVVREFPVPVTPTQVFFTADGEPYRPSEERRLIPFIFYKRRDTDEHVFTVHEGALTAEQMREILIDMGVAE